MTQTSVVSCLYYPQLKQQITKIESENSSLKQKLGKTTDEDEIESKKIEVSLNGNGYIIHSLEAERIIWDKLYQAQTRLLERLDINGKRNQPLIYSSFAFASVKSTVLGVV